MGLNPNSALLLQHQSVTHRESPGTNLRVHDPETINALTPDPEIGVAIQAAIQPTSFPLTGTLVY
jgi:hypothetical protein